MINRNSDSDRRDFKGRNLVLYVFESVMAFFYLAVAYILLFTERFADSIVKEIRLPLGILLGVYGLFRVYRAIGRLTAPKSPKGDLYP